MTTKAERDFILDFTRQYHKQWWIPAAAWAAMSGVYLYKGGDEVDSLIAFAMFVLLVTACHYHMVLTPRLRAWREREHLRSVIREVLAEQERNP